MADFTWTPAGVAMDITITASNPKRTGSGTFTCDVYVKWRGIWSNTNYGMQASAGGQVIDIPKYDTKNHREGSGTMYGCSFSISGNSTTTATISVQLCNYKTDVKNPPYIYNSFDVSVSSIPQYHGSINAGSTSIKDNYNNTFTVTATKGTAANNNTPKALDTLKYSYTSDYATSYNYTNNTPVSLTISGIGNTRTVYAKSRTTATYGSDHKTAKTDEDIRQYLGPYPPSKPIIKYDKSRLTIKEPWKFTWNPATKVNKYSEVVGYRIRLYKNGNVIPNIKLATNSKTKITTGGTNQYIDTDSTLTYVEFDPTDFEFEAGQTVKLGIYAYTRYGQNNDVSGAPDLILFNGTGTNSTNYDSGTNGYSIAEVFSDDYPILNAGVTRVKVDNKWEEGIVYVKADNKWVEADLVYTKADDKWKESE